MLSILCWPKLILLSSRHCTSWHLVVFSNKFLLNGMTYLKPIFDIFLSGTRRLCWMHGCQRVCSSHFLRDFPALPDRENDSNLFAQGFNFTLFYSDNSKKLDCNYCSRKVSQNSMYSWSRFKPDQSDHINRLITKLPILYY